MKRMLSISSQMPTQMQLSFLNKGGPDLHAGLSSAYSSKPSDGQWMNKNLIFEEEQEATVKTQCEDNNVNAKVLQNKKRNGNKRVYECHVCLKRFGAPSKLKRHCLIHTDQRPFQCSICFHGFRERSHLKVHLKTHTNPSSPDQRSQTNTQITTSSPIYLKQKNNGENQCSICLKIFAYPSKLARHILSHTDIRPFKCHMCLKSFQFRWHLQCHVKTHKKKGWKIIAGHLEQDRTVSSSNVEKPKEQDVHTSSQEGAEDSSTVHQDQNMLKENMAYQKMSGDCSDSDVYVQGTLLNEGDLDLQTGQSSAYSSKPEGEWMVKKEEFEEEQEASVTTQSEDNDVNAKALQSKSRNRNKRVYECHVCLKRFGAPSKLKRHCLIHTNQRPFQCSICSSAFRERSHLKAHLRTHTNSSSPNAVTPAGKGILPISKSSDRIGMLQRKKKNGYQCEICLKKFRFPSKLTRHLFVHFDVKAYTCTICRKSFKQANYLHKHLKVHTGKRNDNSRLCRVPQKHGHKSPTPGALKTTNNCRPDNGNVCSPQILHSLETKKHQKPECRSNLHQNVQLIESNSSTIEIKSSNAWKNTEEQITSPFYLKPKHKGVNQCSICLKNFAFPSKLARHILSHTDIRPFKCPMCVKSFQFRWHLQCHVKIHKKKGRNIIAGHSQQDRAVSFSNAGNSKLQDVQISSQDGEEDSATVYQDQNRAMDSQKMSGDSSDSGVCLQVSLLNEGGSDLHTGQSSVPSSKHSEGQWMKQKQEFEEEQEASVTTLKPKHKGVNQCSICLKNFAFPSKLARHILSHTNIRPFKCHMCVKSFQFRWHLQCHVKIHKKKGRNVIAGHSQQDRTVSLSNAGNSKEQIVQISSQDGAEDSGTVHQDQTMAMDSQKMCGDSSNSGVCLQVSLLNDGGSDLHTGQSSAHSSKHSEGQWIKQKQEFEEEQETSDTTQSEDNDMRTHTHNCKPDDGNVCLPQILDSSEMEKHEKPECQRAESQPPTEEQITASSPIYLKRKHKGVNQCSICLKNFAFPSKLARHILSHTNIRPFKCHMCVKSFQFRWHLQCHVKIHKKKGQNIIAGHSQQDRTVSLSNSGNSKEQDVEISSEDGAEDSATVLQDQNMAMGSQKISGDSSDSSVCLQVSLLNEGGSDIHTGQSSVLSSKPSEGQCIKQKEEFEEQEASVTTLTHKHKGVNQCSICLKNFAYPSKLARHILSHTNIRPFKCHMCVKSFQFRWHLQCHVKIHKKKGQNIIAGHSEQDRTVSFSNAGNSKEQDVHTSSQDGAEDSATVHQDQNMVKEDMAYQKISGACSDSDVYLQGTLLNEGDWDLHTGQSSAHSSKPSEGQWMEKKEEFEEEQEASVTTQSEDKDVRTHTHDCKPDNGNTCLPQILDSLEMIKHEKPECRRAESQPPTEEQITTSSTIYLKRKHKGVNQCSICLKNFAYPSKLARHILSHTNIRPFKCHMCVKSFQFRWHLQCHVKIHKKKGRNIVAGHSQQDCTVFLSNAGNSKEQDVQISSQDGAKDSATVHQDQNMAMDFKKMSGDSSNSGVCLQVSLLNDGGSDLHTGQSSAHSSRHSEGQWMKQKQEFEEEQESSVTTLTHKHKGVNQCSICLKNFAYPSKLARHILSHTNIRPFKCHMCVKSFQFRWHLQCHVKIHKKKGRNIAGHSEQDRTVSFSNAGQSKEQDMQISSQDGAEDSATVHQKMSGDSGAYLQVSLLNEGGLGLQTRQSNAYSSKLSVGQWMQESQQVKEEQAASVSTQNEDTDVNAKVLQSENRTENRNKRVCGCPVCHKLFDDPSKLKRHCRIHTNQRPFQCSVCCHAFRERSHLKEHIRIHNIPVKRRTTSLQSYRNNSVPCRQASKLKTKFSPKKTTAQDNTKLTDKENSTVHQEQNMMIAENMASRKIIGDCSNSDAYLQDFLLNEGGLHLHTGQSSAYSSKTLEGQWMEENQESEELQDANVTTQSEDKDLNLKVLQSKNANGNKRVYECPVCSKQFGAPSKLKRHCLIHTNQRPFQCSICCRAFRERSHLKVHVRTHANPVKRRITSLQSYRDNSVLCNQASKSKIKPYPNQLTAQNDTSSTDKQKSTVHQDQKMVKENLASQKMTGGNSNIYLQDSLLNEGLDLHTGQSSAYSSKPSEGHWMEENQESEEEQEASVTTHGEDKDVNAKVLQSKNSNRNKRVYDCHVCHKRFGAPSKLKRHCLIHTNQRPFQCSICSSAFRERSHLKAHLRTHTNPVKRRTSSSQSYRDNSFPSTRASKSRLKVSSKQPIAQGDTKSTDKEKSTVHQDQNMVTENMASQKMSGDCSASDVNLQYFCLNKGGMDLHTGQSSAYSSRPSQCQWMEEIQESEGDQEASVTTQSKDMDVNVKVWQRKNSNRGKRVYECPVCHKRFTAPSKLKRHYLIHTNQRPFQCSVCSSAFRERSHLKVHLRTHTNPVKRRRTSFQSYRDNSFPCTRASKSRLKLSSKQPIAQGDAKSTDKEKSTVDQDQNMVTENMASQKKSGDYSESNVNLQYFLLNKGGMDLHTGQSSAYSSKPSQGQWKGEIQESEEEQEASVTTQSKDMDVNVKVWQRKISNRSKRVYECPVCHKRFTAPSKLKRHHLIHTNQRPFQCSICSSAFRERSHLKVHLRTHTNPVKRRTSSLQSYRDSRLSCTRASKSKLKPSSKQPTAQTNTNSTDKKKSTMGGDNSDSDVYLQDSLLNEGCMDLHTEQSSAYSSKPSEGHWMEEQEASVTTQSKDMDINVKVWQSKNSKRSKRVYECPVCHKRFAAPSKLKRHHLIHTNQRPFQCSICSSAFRERSHLKVHFRTMHRDQNMIAEDTQPQKMSVDCNDSDLYFSKSNSPLETVENKSEVVFQCNNKSLWGLTHETDILLDGKKTSDIVPFGRVSDCPPKTDSSLRHCASESRTEENWAHQMGDVEDCAFVDSDTGKCVPDSSLSSSSQYQQKPDVPRLPEVVVELEDFEDPEECFPNSPHDLPVCPDCSQCFPTVMDLYAHNCANTYPGGKTKKSHQCDICFKFFSAPSKLKRHRVTHTGQRPFQCTQCQKSFTQPHHLKNHMLSHR